MCKECGISDRVWFVEWDFIKLPIVLHSEGVRELDGRCLSTADCNVEDTHIVIEGGCRCKSCIRGQ